MAVLKVKVEFPVIVRLSIPLSCRTRPVPVRPVTVPPMVYGPALPVPVPVPLPEPPTGPLQAARRTELIKKRDAKKGDALADFISTPLLLGGLRVACRSTLHRRLRPAAVKLIARAGSDGAMGT